MSADCLYPAISVIDRCSICLFKKILEVENNPVGIDATIAWFGFGLMIYGIFDLIFFPAYYRNRYKAGRTFIIAAIPMLLMMVIVEGAVRIPQLAWLDIYTLPDLMRQIPVLLIAILCYGCFVTLAYKISVKRFEHVDL